VDGGTIHAEKGPIVADALQPIAVADLPEVITTYLKAHIARDVDPAIDAYLPDGAVTDEGKTYSGRPAIREWLLRSASEYTYSIEATGAFKRDDSHFEVRHHLEGNFPGGQVDLRFRFTIRDDRIAALVIEE
jgi:hypothetical protein